jgi:hypothetical protein
MSTVDSDKTPHKLGQGEPPNVILRATRRRPSYIVILSKLVALDSVATPICGIQIYFA